MFSLYFSLSPALYLFLRRRKRNLKKKIKITKQRQKTHKQTNMEPVPTGHRASPGLWLLQQATLHQRKLISPSQQVPIAHSFLGRGGTLSLLLILHPRTLSGFNLFSFCACCHSLCEFRLDQSGCVWKTLCPWRHLPLLPLTIFCLICFIDP